MNFIAILYPYSHIFSTSYLFVLLLCNLESVAKKYFFCETCKMENLSPIEIVIRTYFSNLPNSCKNRSWKNANSPLYYPTALRKVTNKARNEYKHSTVLVLQETG